ncbi:MAG: AraC family transcriptional regulator [Vagococcus sp.]
MEKTTFEFVQMDQDLPMRILHFSKENPQIYSQMDITEGNSGAISFIPIHWHKELELTYVVKGSLELRKNTKSKVYEDGSFFIVNSGEIHELKGTLSPEFNVICFIISYEFVKRYLPNIDTLYFDLGQTQQTHDKMAALFLSILESFQSEDPFANLSIQSDLLALFHLLCSHHLVDRKEEVLRSDYTNQLNQKILEYIHGHYAEKITLDDIATHFNFSREHFARVFKEQFSRTFLSYLTDYRLYRAFPEIMKGNKTIEIISQEHGFPSSKALIRHFKNVYQDTPIQYRKKNDVKILDHNDEINES